jgi:predicted amidohydrolase YtcJ
MYTIEAAYVMRQEGITGTGSLVVGKQADLIVIDQDIFNPIKGIEVTKVLQTVVGGEEVYSTLPMPKI